MPVNMKNINNFTQWKKWISWCDVRARDYAPKAHRAVLAQYAECSGHFQYTPRIYWRANQRTRNFVGVYECQSKGINVWSKRFGFLSKKTQVLGMTLWQKAKPQMTEGLNDYHLYCLALWSFAEFDSDGIKIIIGTSDL